jgi:hypothetical protein
MRKLLLGTLAVTALSLPMSAFTTDLASARALPHGFSKGQKEGWERGRSPHNVPPGWRSGHGQKEGLGHGHKASRVAALN